ncbi:LPS assembly protein LptD [Vibrio sp. SCSIO 43136]|uniref:LPS assembly protein LptD n=1 Tax=Vibrio sp. SCSIO 43136 TaxID=2819101 RepID=UPI002074AEAC|nr:LPS assembly protein LptD [Vibrio sp. SCSIO 43136]USD66716.1 LPS assembly protein LptD [Vibrio sp. SCSIO 43136]
MFRTSRTLLAVSVSAALTTPALQAEEQNLDSVQQMPPQDQCLVAESAQNDINNQPIHIKADRVIAEADKRAVYEGDVTITQGVREIRANSITHKPVEQTMIAEGDVRFKDAQVKAKADKITAQLDSDETRMENTQYQFLCESGRGDAAMVLKTGQKVYEMEDGSLTSCPEGDNTWMLKAGSIEVDQEEQYAYFYHTRFEVLDVPVMYIPYMSMPVGGQRKTGMLFPTISLDTKDGLKVKVPVYWNLAPNYDLTTTINYMERRGTQFTSDFRYLTNYGSGDLRGEYIGSDSQYSKDAHRWAFGYTHSGIIAENWKVDIDYSRISDKNYFKDLESSVGNREDGQLLQKGSASYRQENWDVELTVKDFQILDSADTSTQPYQLLPQLKFNYYAPSLYDGVNFDVLGHISRFEIQDTSRPTATRLHLEPGIIMPFSKPWGSLTGEARMLATYYQQEFDSSETENANYEEEVARALPELRLLGELNLERQTGEYLQTLEPKVQYLYIPDVDQTNIALYDTTNLQTDYYGLFRSRRHSGVDRINQANQISYGATTRFYDSNYKERMNVSFGQIYYLNRESASTDQSSYSAWAIEADFNFSDYLFYHGGIQYDVASSALQLGNSTLEYRFDQGYVQGNYRYVSKEYINSNVSFINESNTYTRNGISQAGLLTGFDINRNWKAEVQYFHDITENVRLESLAKLGYTSDCWFISFAYSNQIRDWEGGIVGATGTEPSYESNFKFDIGIRGFGTELSSTQSTDNALGYGRPFYLNN